MKTSTVALVVTYDAGTPLLMDIISNVHEIEFIEAALRAGEPEPLEKVYENRAMENKQENDFGNYVEDLLSKPFLKAESQKHGLQWLKSKIKIEHFQKIEQDAAKVISEYAYKIFQEDQSKTDFFIASSNCQVRIRVFALPLVRTMSA